MVTTPSRSQRVNNFKLGRIPYSFAAPSGRAMYVMYASRRARKRVSPTAQRARCYSPSTTDSRADHRAVIALAYRSLVRDTLLPSDPTVIGRAALAGPGITLPVGFGSDVERDAEWLARQAAEAPVWPVIQAMAHAADKPHTGLSTIARGARLAALQTGAPEVNPGFAAWLQPDGRLAVADVDARGSAHAGGLRQGDLIETLDGVPPRASGLEIMRFYSAAAGAKLVLQVDRGGQRLSVDMVMRRGDVPVVTYQTLPGDVAYVNVRWFASSEDARTDTAASVRSALAAFVAQAAQGVVIDLRSGMGGSIKAVASIISAMSAADSVVASLDSDGLPVKVPRNGVRIWPDLPIAVLVNEQSTSAAEFLAIGLEELSGAALVGTPTSGGLNFLRFVDLGEGYVLALPGAPGLGPRSLAARSGHRLVPTIRVPNPSASQLVAGVDGQLEAAHHFVTGSG